MRKEYDLKALKVKRRGPIKGLKAAVRSDATELKNKLLKDRDFIRKVARQVGR